MFGASCSIIFAVIWLNLHMTVRAHYDRVPHMSQYDIPPEVMNQDDIYNESKYADSPGSFADNWPWSNEYQDTAFGGKTQDNFDEQYNGGGKSVEEPPRLAGSNGAIAERLPIPMALEGRGKNLPAKKNLYMARCNFKICNMGRKRNARYISLHGMMDKLRKTRSLQARPVM